LQGQTWRLISTFPSPDIHQLFTASHPSNKRGTLNQQSAFPKTQQLFLHTQDSVFGSFGDPELHDFHFQRFQP